MSDSRSAPVTDVDLNKLLDAKRRELEGLLERLGVMRDLEPKKCERLADIVQQFSAEYGLSHAYPNFEKWLRVDQRDGPRQRRMFHRKVNKARLALDDALDYVSRVNNAARPNKLLARRLRFATLHLQEARKELEGIAFEGLKETVTGVGFKNPKSEARSTVLAFFVKECGLTRSEASVRTGQIGNELLGWNIDLEDHHDSHNPKRARAVLKSAARQVKRR